MEENKEQNISFKDADTRKTKEFGDKPMGRQRLDFTVNDWTEWTNEKKQSTLIFRDVLYQNNYYILQIWIVLVVGGKDITK